MAIKSIEITNLTNNQLYGFRMFPRNLKGQYQTRDDKGTALATPKSTIPISNLPIGTVVRGQINNINYNFLVANQNNLDSDYLNGKYDKSCIGTWLLLNPVYELREFNGGNTGSYSASRINHYLNNDFYSLFETKFRNCIKNIKIPYEDYPLDEQIGENGLQCKIFLLSETETNWLQIFRPEINPSYVENKTGRYNSEPVKWWIRTPYGKSAKCVHSDGRTYQYEDSWKKFGVRPCVIFDFNTQLNPIPNSDGSYNIN